MSRSFKRIEYLKASEIYGLERYASIMGAHMAHEAGDTALAAVTRKVLNFKKNGKHAGDIARRIRLFADYLQLEHIMVVPSSTAGNTSELQKLFGAAIERTKTVAKRKYGHGPISNDYAESWRIADKAPALGKVLLIDDVCTTGRTLEHFAERLKAAGYEPICLAVGLNVKLDPKAEFILMFADESAPDAVNAEINTDIEASAGDTELNRRARIFDGALCLSSAAMVEVFGVTRQALGGWAKSGCPKAKAGWWPLADVLRWRGLSADRRESDDANLNDMQLKLRYDAECKRLQAEQLDLKNAIARGEFIPRDEIVSELSRHFTELKRSLQGLGRKIATDVGPFVDPQAARRIERDLSNLIADALERMSSGEIYVAPKRRIIKG